MPVKNNLIEAVNRLAQKLDSDVVIINSRIISGLSRIVYNETAKQKKTRKNLHLFLCTEGGDAHAAFRIMRHFQRTYESITIVVSGWCKSAGTLMCIGGNELVMTPLAELGPLDVQLAKSDELFESSSGLAVDSAFQKLREESHKIFINHVYSLKMNFKRRMTFKTAVKAATDLTNASMSPIFEKFDPFSIGEDYRAYQIAEKYGERLNRVAENLKVTDEINALNTLLGHYPSHGFVIDFEEASELFERVVKPQDDLLDLISQLAKYIAQPLEDPICKYLNTVEEDDYERDITDQADFHDGKSDGVKEPVPSSSGSRRKQAKKTSTGTKRRAKKSK